MATDSYEAVLQALQERLDGTVMSKFARRDDCTLYREAVEHCMEIVRQVRDAHPPESGDGWVPVTERLPAIGQSVALVNIHRWENCGGDMERNVHDAGYLAEIHGQTYWSVRGERAQSTTAFTHWMPLPSPFATGGAS